MLSILIPIYNQDVRPLVFGLANQCQKLGIRFQILCFDDGSKEHIKLKNRELGLHLYINYTELTENLGRARIRNWLGNAAMYPYLLFLDGDSVIKSKNFIKNYIRHLPLQGIVSGGRMYNKRTPGQKKILHWKYGKKFESRSPRLRQKNPLIYFHTNNFIISAQAFTSCPFDASLYQYGYEDVLFAFEAQKKGISIHHIDNPTLHGQLDNAKDFIEKQKLAMQNLRHIMQWYPGLKTPIIQLTNILKQCGLLKYVIRLLKWKKQHMMDHLLGPDPNVYVLQLLKLYYFCSEETNNHSKI